MTLPSTPPVYYLGVKVDPFHTLKQQGHVPTARRLDAYAKVGPPIPGLPPTPTSTGTGSTPTRTPSPTRSPPSRS